MRRFPSKVVAIVQVRMGAARLFGKPLKKVLNKPLLEYLIERLKRSKLIDEIILATTEQAQDDLFLDFAKKNGIRIFRGSEQDVLARYLGAALFSHADPIVRITGDCPLIDPKVVDQVIDFYLKNFPKFDYVSNTLKRTFPRGLDVEVFSLKALQIASENAASREEKEHVTPYIYGHAEIFKLANIEAKEDNSIQRWTVDTEEDFELIKKMIKWLYPKNPNFSQEDLLDLVKKHPELSKINAHIEQKKL